MYYIHFDSFNHFVAIILYYFFFSYEQKILLVISILILMEYVMDFWFLVIIFEYKIKFISYSDIGEHFFAI